MAHNIYFGKKIGNDYYGFYLDSDNMDSYKVLTEKEHNDFLIKANEQNKTFDGDENGNPVLIDFPSLSKEELIADEINELKNYLSLTDWYAIRLADDGTPIPPEIKEQRKLARQRISELRD